MGTAPTKGADPGIGHRNRRDALFGVNMETLLLFYKLGHFRDIIRYLCLHVQMDILFSLEKRDKGKAHRGEQGQGQCHCTERCPKAGRAEPGTSH